MNKLSTERRRAVVALLMEGVGINATCRLTGAAKMTVLSLLSGLGDACAKFHNERVRGLRPARVECDEIWSFCFCKEKNVKNLKNPIQGAGDVWTWTAIDADSKLMISYLIGQRTPECAFAMMDDLAGRVTNTIQLTSDGLLAYPPAVYEAFGTNVDYAQLVKIYGENRDREAHYSPATCIGCKKKHVIGCPNPDAISTSIVERSNLSIRMHQRRYTRLTNGHSKKLLNHGASTSIFFTFYNWIRKHQSLPRNTTPAMAAGLTDRVWKIEELISILDSN